MWNQFFLQNLHFAVNIFAAMVFLWIFWLYFDVWLARRKSREVVKSFGFLFLAISCVVQAVYVESSMIATSVISDLAHSRILIVTRIAGYLLIGISLFLEQSIAHPHEGKVKGKTQEVKANLQNIASGFLMISLAGAQVPGYVLARMFFPISATAVALLYLYKSTHGLEFHLRRVAYGFFVLSFYELVSLRQLFTTSSNISLYKLVQPFAFLWILEEVLLLIGCLLLGKWVFGYLLKRLETQLYMFFSLRILFIFLISTVTFTGLLLKNMQSEALRELETSVRVLEYALDAKSAGLTSDAEVFAKDTKVLDAILADQKPTLANFTSDFLVTKSLNTLIVTNSDAEVIARGEEPERIGESVSGNSMIARTLVGESVSSATTQEGLLAPQIVISSSVPVKNADEQIIGSVKAGILIDNAFVDGIEKATGLAVSIYGGEKVSATTLLAADKVTRRVGISESDKRILELVLAKGESFTGTTQILNTPYFASYLPLTDVDATPVGMLFVGRPQISVLQTAAASIQLTFVVTGILWLLAIIPSYLIASYISKQLR